MKDPVDHIERPRLPWRPQDDASMTECGLAAVKVKTLTRTDFTRRMKEYGEQRTALLTCMTCMQTARRWRSWDDEPREALHREIEWEGRWATNRGVQLRDELRAIARLIEAHHVEFLTYIRQEQGTVDFVSEKIKRGK